MIGPNGAGKTTFFNLLTGFLTPTSGRILLRGKDIAGLPPSRIASLGLCRTFQITSVFPGLTVWENLLTGTHCWTRTRFLETLLRSRGWAEQHGEMEKQAGEILEFLRMEGQKETRARNLSYGDQRRLEIGIALASRREFLLLDEPAAGMNPEETQSLGRDIQQIRKRGITVLLIEHHMQLVMDICDRIAVLNYGKKIAEGTPLEISQNPEVIEAYLGKEDDLA